MMWMSDNHTKNTQTIKNRGGYIMLSVLSGWQGKIELNGTLYDSVKACQSENKTLSEQFSIKLLPKTETRQNGVHTQAQDDTEYKITVKKYMTRKATPEFNFMAQWNNDNPMPLVTMVGKKIKETKGMVYMQLHGVGEATITCMCCGKELTNPISRHYGIGPVCMSKVGIIADIEDVDTIKEKLAELTWEGWIIKSAIIEEVEV